MLRHARRVNRASRKSGMAMCHKATCSRGQQTIPTAGCRTPVSCLSKGQDEGESEWTARQVAGGRGPKLPPDTRSDGPELLFVIPS
eukprot:scaffold139_cov325-Pavlova_lutheri.AAC.49